MTKRIHTNLIQQNCYVRDFVEPFDVKTEYLDTNYISVDAVVDSSGVSLRKTINPYPITPDSVTSYADGCDYTSDLAASMNSSAPGSNLGDLTALQAFSQLSRDEQLSLISSLRDKMSEKSTTTTTTTKDTTNKDTTNKGE